jgi:hypothetical protein
MLTRFWGFNAGFLTAGEDERQPTFLSTGIKGMIVRKSHSVKQQKKVTQHYGRGKREQEQRETKSVAGGDGQD